MTRLPIAGQDGAPADHSIRVVSPYMVGVFLAINAIRDAYLLVEGPDCVHMKTQFVQGTHDWLSTLTSVSGFHRIANTALHPVGMTASREEELVAFLTRMAARPGVGGLCLSSMPMALITGADYDRLCGDVAAATGKAVIPIPSKSLSGDWLDGYSEALASLGKRLDLSGGDPRPERVGIVGNLYDRNEGDHRANVRHLRDLLEGLGLEVTSIWLEGGGFAELSRIRDAGTLLSFPYGRRAARAVARQTGAAVLECPLPFGLTATEAWLRMVAEALGREDRLPALLDRELSRVIPSLEWIQPLVLQGRHWAYMGDPHLVVGLHGIAQLVGARLVLAVITNPAHHAKGLSEVLGESTRLVIAPPQRSRNRFIAESLSDEGVDLLVCNSDGSTACGDVALVELGFPSAYHHCLFERPFLGFQGFLAFIDSVANATRRQALLVAHGRHRGPDPRDADR